MKLKTEVTFAIHSSDEERIIDSMSDAMGNQVEKIKKTDMASMSKGEWRSIVESAWVTAANECFSTRLKVYGPIRDDEIPF